MIEIEHLYKVYNDANPHEALHDINLVIEDGDTYALLGQSGAGKSTLVRCINLLEQPTSGVVRIDGRDITGLRGKELLGLRSSIGMIFQSFSLFAQRTVLDNITFPLELRGEKRKAAVSRARELLEIVELGSYEKRYPSQLSGGQQQRVAIARALANNPKIMLCDEATSALDTRTTVSILNLLRKINSELGVTLVVITHALNVAEALCEKVAIIDNGQIVERGYTRELFANPQSNTLRELIDNNRAAQDLTIAFDEDLELALVDTHGEEEV
ncbi:MAG: methionine ABC transporter ATP-binding protein [Coriobacteriales bacterium]|jgi:D-methionine transport system ATP-binding protein